jgi:hypothetical protein
MSGSMAITKETFMKVNKSSWHYRLMNYFNFKITDDLDYNRNVTLCRYFWNVVGSLISLLGGVLVGIAVAGIMCLALFAFLIAPISYLTQSYFGFGWDFATDLGFIMIWIIWVIVPFFMGLEATIKGNMKVFPNWMKIKPPEPAPDNKPNLLVEYVKAKKSKFCPLIELDEDN